MNKETIKYDAAEIIKDILEERKRQDEGLEEQSHPAPDWACIIGKKYGEVCDAIHKTMSNPAPENEKTIYANTIQMMVYCMAMLECMDMPEKNKMIDKNIPEETHQVVSDEKTGSDAGGEYKYRDADYDTCAGCGHISDNKYECRFECLRGNDPCPRGLA